MTKKVVPLHGDGGKMLAESIRQIVHSNKWELPKPLPTTREFGRRFGVSNTSAFRVLQKLQIEGLLWQAENGRYYLSQARSLVTKPKPIACLLRKLQIWTKTYQSIMAGFSEACGVETTSMLFVHNETLVQHPNLSEPPKFATLTEQKQTLEDFLERSGNMVSGLLLDSAWSDKVLSSLRGKFERCVVLYRNSNLGFGGNVHMASEAGGMLALAHLMTRGFKEIWIARPFAGYAPIEEMIEALIRAATEAGMARTKLKVVFAATPAERQSLIKQLKSSPSRIGVYCPDDNVSRILQQAFQEAKLPVPEKVGLLSGMGTIAVTEHKISSVQYDFQKIGKVAAEMLFGDALRKISIEPELFFGGTT